MFKFVDFLSFSQQQASENKNNAIAAKVQQNSKYFFSFVPDPMHKISYTLCKFASIVTVQNIASNPNALYDESTVQIRCM